MVEDWHVIVTLREAIIAGTLNFKIAASRFVNNSGEVINPIEENSIAKGTKDATEFGGTLFERKI